MPQRGAPSKAISGLTECGPRRWWFGSVEFEPAERGVLVILIAGRYVDRYGSVRPVFGVFAPVIDVHALAVGRAATQDRIRVRHGSIRRRAEPGGKRAGAVRVAREAFCR